MPNRLILLTDNAFSEDLRARLVAPNAGLNIDIAGSQAELAAALSQSSSPTRLMAFGSDVIVPPEVLNSLPGPAYNFHPGPPEYRGLFPSVFALYDNAANFGVTCHEMTATVDSGAIVAVQRFAIPANANRGVLDALTYRAMLDLVEKCAPTLCDTTKPLAHIAETWAGPIRRRSDFNALCQLPPNVTETEFQRRYRAIGEGPHHALSFEMFGQRFKLDNRREGPVVRGGREIS